MINWLKKVFNVCLEKPKKALTKDSKALISSGFDVFHKAQAKLEEGIVKAREEVLEIGERVAKREEEFEKAQAEDKEKVEVILGETDRAMKLKDNIEKMFE